MERRYYKNTEIEVRDSGVNDTRTISGYGIVFNSESRVLRTADGQKFVEVIKPESVDGLLDSDEIRAYFNHDKNIVLARNKRTMTLTKDDFGVRYEFVPPNSPNGQNIMESIMRGDVDTSSFAFTVADGGEQISRRADGMIVRTITRMEGIYDMSPVCTEAYPTTSVGVRSIDQWIETNETEKRKLVEDQFEMDQLLLKIGL
jgi:HK97 family phage prohead protease